MRRGVYLYIRHTSTVHWLAGKLARAWYLVHSVIEKMITHLNNGRDPFPRLHSILRLGVTDASHQRLERAKPDAPQQEKDKQNKTYIKTKPSTGRGQPTSHNTT